MGDWEDRFEHALLSVQQKTIDTPSGPLDAIRIHSADWVNVVAITTDERVVLIRQPRYGIEQETLEIPGGIVDDGEEPLEAAKRELAEETGFGGGEWSTTGFVHPNPAIQDNRAHMFLVRDVERQGEQDTDEHEEIEVELVPLGEVLGLLMRGEITHALVVAALQAAILHSLDRATHPRRELARTHPEPRSEEPQPAQDMPEPPADGAESEEEEPPDSELFVDHDEPVVVDSGDLEGPAAPGPKPVVERELLRDDLSDILGALAGEVTEEVPESTEELLETEEILDETGIEELPPDVSLEEISPAAEELADYGEDEPVGGWYTDEVPRSSLPFFGPDDSLHDAIPVPQPTGPVADGDRRDDIDDRTGFPAWVVKLPGMLEELGPPIEEPDAQDLASETVLVQWAAARLPVVMYGAPGAVKTAAIGLLATRLRALQDAIEVDAGLRRALDRLRSYRTAEGLSPVPALLDGAEPETGSWLRDAERWWELLDEGMKAAHPPIAVEASQG